MIYQKSLTTIFVALLFITMTSVLNFETQKNDENVGIVLVKSGHEGVSGDSLLSHFFPFYPSCIYPTHTAAFAIFITGSGPVQVQFHGTDTWTASAYCYDESCMWEANAIMRSGDEIWVYSVDAVSSTHVSNWCATYAK